MKTIITHLSVDLDAITSSWLIKRFMPGWANAQLQFVPAGTTLNNQDPDKNPDIVHVDTGLGKFDHHQIKSRSQSATKRVFEYLEEQGYVKSNHREPLTRIVDFVTSLDNFGEIHFHDPTSDIYDFGLHQLTEGLKGTNKTDVEICEIYFQLLDGALQFFKRKIEAEKEIKKGLVFQSRLGKTLAMETPNEESVKLALKSGFEVVIRKDPIRGFVRIKTYPDDKYDLTQLYEKLKEADPKAKWFLHISKNMLLNGSSKDPNAVPSSLSLKKVIEIIRSI